jgi:hypothetical protein
MMMLGRGLRAAIAPKPLVAANLIQMRSEMNGAKQALHLTNRRRRGSEPLGRDIVVGKKPVEGAFALDQLHAERLRSGTHAIENRLQVAAPGLRQPELRSKL